MRWGRSMLSRGPRRHQHCRASTLAPGEPGRSKARLAPAQRRGVVQGRFGGSYAENLCGEQLLWREGLLLRDYELEFPAVFGSQRDPRNETRVWVGSPIRWFEPNRLFPFPRWIHARALLRRGLDAAQLGGTISTFECIIMGFVPNQRFGYHEVCPFLSSGIPSLAQRPLEGTGARASLGFSTALCLC